MDRSPCLDCDHGLEDKRQPVCVECTLRQEYADSIGRVGTALPLEVCDMVSGYRPWSKEDEQYLIDNYMSMSDKNLSLKLNRSVNAIVQRRHYLKLSKRQAVYKKINDEPGQGVAAITENQKAHRDFLRDQEIDTSPTNSYYIQFNPDGDLYDRFLSFCKSKFRKPEEQILYMITKAVNKHERCQSTK